MSILDKYPHVRNELEDVLRDLGAEDEFIDTVGFLLQLELEDVYPNPEDVPLKVFLEGVEKTLLHFNWSTARTLGAVQETHEYIDVPLREPGKKLAYWIPTGTYEQLKEKGVPDETIKRVLLQGLNVNLFFYWGAKPRQYWVGLTEFMLARIVIVTSMANVPEDVKESLAGTAFFTAGQSASRRNLDFLGDHPWTYPGQFPPEPEVIAQDRLTIFTMAPIVVGPQLLIAEAKDLLEAWRQEARTPFEVEIPGLDEFIKLGPELVVSEATREEWRAWRQNAKDAGFPALEFDLAKIAAAEGAVGRIPLTTEEFFTMKKTWERARRLRLSPTPEVVQKVGSILTAIDNVQDAMITTTYLSRVGVKILSKYLPKLALKFMPGLGYIALATDLLDVQRLLAAMFRTRSIRKTKSYDILKIYPNAARKKALRLLKTRGYLPTFREAIQIAQTTEWLTGYGLSLGAGVAFLEDLFFGLVRGARFKIPLTETYIAWPGLVPDVIKKAIVNIADVLGGSPEVSIVTLEALRTLNFAPIAMMYAEHLSDEDNLVVLTGAYQAAKYLERSGDLKNWHEWAKPYLDTPIDPRPISPAVRDALQEAGDTDIKDVYPWPFFDGVNEITPRMRVALMAPKIVSSMRKWLMSMPPGPAVQYAMTLYSDLGEVMFRALEGPDEPIEVSISPEWRAPYLIQEYGLWDEIKGNDDLAINVSAQITDFLIRRQHKSPTLDEVKAVIDLFKRASALTSADQ